MPQQAQGAGGAVQGGAWRCSACCCCCCVLPATAWLCSILCLPACRPQPQPQPQLRLRPASVCCCGWHKAGVWVEGEEWWLHSLLAHWAANSTACTLPLLQAERAAAVAALQPDAEAASSQRNFTPVSMSLGSHRSRVLGGGLPFPRSSATLAASGSLGGLVGAGSGGGGGGSPNSRSPFQAQAGTPLLAPGELAPHCCLRACSNVHPQRPASLCFHLQPAIFLPWSHPPSAVHSSTCFPPSHPPTQPPRRRSG